MSLGQKYNSWSGNTLSGKRKVLITVVSKEGHADRLLWHEKIHYLVSFLMEYQTHRLFHAKAILVERQKLNYLTHSWGDNRVYTFPKSISLKVNTIVQLEFELTYYNVTIQLISYYALGLPLPRKRFNCKWCFLLPTPAARFTLFIEWPSCMCVYV